MIKVQFGINLARKTSMSRFIFISIFIFFIPIVGSAQLRLSKIEKLPKKMYETSGLLLYQNKYLITHNDGGNKSEIYIVKV